MDKFTEQILRRRMHGLYLSRGCEDIIELSRELLGLHCWFHRNVVFSALIRGADITGWKNALVKTWLYRGTLHGVVFDELPLLLAPHAADHSYEWLILQGLLSEEQLQDAVDRVMYLLSDGVYSRAEMRRIFSYDYSREVIDHLFSSWGGIFITLAAQGKVAFRSMVSRDFDLIDAPPVQMSDEVLSELLRRFFKAYGPATIEDAMWFLGLEKKIARDQPVLEELSRIEKDRKVYYYVDEGSDMGDIPELTLLSGFDPLIVSYKERGSVLPDEYKKAVILKSGICLPTIAVDGRVAGIWNIKNGKPTTEFFSPQPPRIIRAAEELAEEMQWRTAGNL